MKLRIVCVGKPAPFLRKGVEEYTDRISRYLPLETIELKDEKGGRKPDPGFICNREGKRILERIQPRAFVIALDERGKTSSSEEFAGLLGQHMLEATADLTLVVGGAYGLSDEIKARANLVLSLSAMTMTHQMARLLLLEQIYRGLTILRNEPYHNR